MNQTIKGLVELAKFLKTLKPEFNEYFKAKKKASGIMNQVKELSRIHPMYKSKEEEAYKIVRQAKNKIIQLVYAKIHELGLYNQDITFQNIHIFSSLLTQAVNQYIYNEIRQEDVNELEAAYSEYLEFKRFSGNLLEDFDILQRLDRDVFSDLFKPLKGNKEYKESPLNDYTGKEVALAYLFDLDVTLQEIPKNPKTGQLSKKEIQLKASDYNIKPESFYKSVKAIYGNYNIYNLKDLKQISSRWKDAVLDCSIDSLRVKEYLKEKKLI